jgi:hypothetical protein
MKKDDFINNVAALVAYLAWQDPDTMSGGRTGREARIALCNILQMPGKVFAIMKGEEPKSRDGVE